MEEEADRAVLGGPVRGQTTRPRHSIKVARRGTHGPSGHPRVSGGPVQGLRPFPFQSLVHNPINLSGFAMFGPSSEMLNQLNVLGAFQLSDLEISQVLKPRLMMF